MIIGKSVRRNYIAPTNKRICYIITNVALTTLSELDMYSSDKRWFPHVISSGSDAMDASCSTYTERLPATAKVCSLKNRQRNYKPLSITSDRPTAQSSTCVPNNIGSRRYVSSSAEGLFG